MNIVKRLEELQNQIKVELEKEEPDMILIKKLRSQIMLLGMQITPLDMYNSKQY
jgi:hypothetical protein